MKKPTRILIVEDAAADAELAQQMIRKVLKRCEFQVVETRKDFLPALETFQPDIILADSSLPRFNSTQALKLVLKHAPLTPLIIWAGSVNEDVAVDCIKAGASNYLLKDNLQRLGPAVLRALEERQLLLERKLAEERYQSIFENSADGIFQSTREGRYLNVNAAMAKIYGYESPRDLIESVVDIASQIYLEPGQRTQFVELLEKQGMVENYEQQNRCKDGGLIWTSTSARVVRDAQGDTLYIEGFVRNISARKAMEERLRDSESQYRTLVEQLPAITYISGLDQYMGVAYISPQIEALGFDLQQWLADPELWFRQIHPDDRERVLSALEQFRAGGAVFRAEYRLVLPDGQIRWFDDRSVYVRDQNGEPILKQGFMLDITERKEGEEALRKSQAQYQNLVETSHDLIWAVDAEGRFTFVNRAAREIYGYEPDELIGRSFFDIMDPEHYAVDGFKKLKDDISGANEFNGVESHVLHRDGRRIILSANAVLLRDNDGMFTGVMGTSRDITARKQVENVLKEERNLLRTLIDNVPDRIYAMDTQGRKILSNTADWKASGGKTMEDVLGKTHFDTYRAELPERSWQHDKAVLESGIPVINHEEPGLDEEGNLVSILTTKIPLRDENGNVTGLVGIGRDITERKHVEAHINDLLAFNEKILNHSPLGILTYKFTGECVFANTNAASIIGASVEQLQAQNFHTIGSWQKSGLYDLVQSAIATGLPVTADIHHHSTFGKDVWLTAHCVTFHSKDEAHLLLTITEISERKLAQERLRQSESRYRLATKATNDVIWEWSPETDQLFWSENAAIAFGYAPEEIAPYARWWDEHLHPDDCDRVVSKLNDLVEGGGSIWLDEYRFLRKDGSYAHISDRGYVERDPDGRPLRLIGAMSDITQRKESEIERQALLEIRQGLANTNDLQELLKLIHHSIARVIYAENFFVVLHQRESGSFEEIYSVDQYDQPETPSNMEKSITAYVFRSGEPLLLTQARFDELVAQNEVKLIGTNSKSWLGVPLKTSDGIIGVMVVQDYEIENRYSENDKGLLASIASQVALAIQRKQADIELQQKNIDLGLLNAVNEAVVRGENLDSVIELLAKGLSQIFSKQGNTISSTIYMLTPEKQSIVMQKYFFSPEKMRNIEKLIGFSIPNIEIPIKEGGHFHKAMVSRRTVITSGSEDIKAWLAEFIETRFLPPLAKPLIRKLIPQIHKILNIKSAIAVPLISEDKTIGFLDVSGSDLFTVNDIKRIENIGGQLVAAIQRQQANEKLRRSEEFLQSIQNALSASIAILNETGTIVQVNSAWRAFGKQNGLVHPEYCVGLNYLEICDSATGLHAEEAPLVAQAIRTVLAGQRSESRIEYPCHSPEANHWFTLHITKFEDGDHTWVVLAHEDITERKQAEVAEQEQRALAEALRATAETLGSTLDYGELLDHILFAADRVVPHDAATIMLIEGEIARVVRLRGYEQHDIGNELGGIRLRVAETSNLRQMLETRQPVVVRDTRSYPGWKRLASTEWLGSSVGAPIIIYGEVIGFICLDSQQSEYFSPVHAERLQAFANQAALAIHNARLLQQAQVEIAERRQAEKELRASEERFRQLADNIQEGFWITDAETGAEIYMSPAVEQIWGQPVDYLLHEPNAFINSVFPDDQPAILQALEREKNGERVEVEYRIVQPNGSLRWVWDRAFPIFDESGKVTRIAGISADVTERRDAEIALVKSQSRYRELFDSSPISLWEEDFSRVKQQIDLLLESGITDLREYFSSHPDQLAEIASLVQITDANQAALGLYRMEQKEAVLKGLTQILSEDALSHFQEEILGLVSPSKRFVWEGTDRMLNGRHLEVIVTGSIPHGYENDWSKVIVSVTDISERKRAEEEMRRRAEETAALLETSQALTDLDLSAILRTISSSAKTLFAADGCRIFLMEPDNESLRCVLALQESREAFSDLRIRVGQGVTGTVAASGQAEIVNEMQNDPRAVEVPGTPENEAEAIMFAPLKEREHTIGVLSIRRAGGARHFQPADLELLEAFAAMAASAVSNARLFEETQRRLTELEALYENGLAVGRLLEPRQIGERIIETFASYLRWHHVTIRLKREESENLELVAFNLPDLDEGERTNTEQHFVARVNKVGQGLSGWVIQTGQALRTGNVHAHTQYVNTHSEIQSGLYMPLKAGERVIGVISVESELPDAFTEQDERLLATLASQAAIAFENARLYETIQKELSERKRVEEALRVSEAHYRELADSITDILFELNHELHFTHWNRASEVLTGTLATFAIGKSMQDIFGESDEQSRMEKIFEQVLRERQPRTFETALVPTGTERFFEVNVYPSRRGVSVVAKDVTDRKRTETIMQKRFELMEYSAGHTLSELIQRTVDEISVLTGSTIGFLHFVEPDQRRLGMQVWSTNALRLFNVPVSEGTHRPLDQAGRWAEAVRLRRPLIHNDYASLPPKTGLPPEHAPIVREIVVPIIRNEKLVAVIGIANKPQDYTPHDLEMATRLVDYAWDITERKQMEIALETERNQLVQRVEERTADLSRANSNLARALRVKDEFLANMSHELRTPLNAILGLSESLAEQIAGPLNEKQQKYITTIGESGHHLLALINDILDLAKIEAGQITLDINKVDIHSVCQASLRMIKQLAQKKNQEVALKIEDGLGLMWADERRLKQMIVNLLGNAVKFTPEDGKIGLEVHGDEEANKITVTVWDNGIGIKAEDLERLFQPFVQLDSGLARETTGTGLGLALVAQMARLHGGSVNAFSEPGTGSRFSIVLPWEPALAFDSATRLRITGKFRAIRPDEAKKPTILLVEDTKEVIMMLQDYLELAGYKIVTAQDGVDALVQAKLVRPDLILMDIQMPRMDGMEATRKLRSEPEFRYTPIIALTALAMPNDRERCLAAGMDEYISKPINLKALVKIIQSCLFSTREPSHP